MTCAIREGGISISLSIRNWHGTYISVPESIGRPLMMANTASETEYVSPAACRSDLAMPFPVPTLSGKPQPR